MKIHVLAVLFAMVFALAIAPALPVDSFGAVAQVPTLQTSMDAVSKAMKMTNMTSRSTTTKEAKPTPQPTMDMHAMPMTQVENLTPTDNPLYPVSVEVVIGTDHMPGMMGAKGIVSGVFDTTLYAVDYTASDGTVAKNHRWVIAEEIDDSAGRTFEVGDIVTLGHGHMGSMGGAGQSAVIAQVVPGPAYMVDYDPTDGSARVANHQWVAEFELQSTDSAS